MTTSTVNPAMTLESTGFPGASNVHYNLLEPALVQQSVRLGEAELGQGGAVLVATGSHVGRSPLDKHVVVEPTTENTIWWENNARMQPEHFEQLRLDMLEHIKGKELFVQDLYAGADPDHGLNVRLINELAWHNLFIRHMLRRPDLSELADFVPELLF